MAYVSTLISNNHQISNPTWEQIEGEIRKLDGSTYSGVILAPSAPLGVPEGEHHMGIAGGLNGNLVVYMTEDNQAFWNARENESRPLGSVTMTVGGQDGDYSFAELVATETAVSAAREYFRTGGRSALVRWELQ